MTTPTLEEMIEQMQGKYGITAEEKIGIGLAVTETYTTAKREALREVEALATRLAYDAGLGASEYEAFILQAFTHLESELTKN